MTRFRLALVTLLLSACGDNDTGLEGFYPPLPPTTGEAASAFAGEVTDASQLVTGPAQSGLVGDFFMKNDRVTFIIQAPTRVIGVIPQGGNVVDAVLTDGTHQTVDDHFGELGLIYLFGRTCEPDHVEIVRDGSKGGVAVIRSVGKTADDDFLNIKGIGVFSVDPTEDPAVDDKVQCATTYILAPGTTTLEVYHSLFNPTNDQVAGPMGTLADTGGNTEAWTNSLGFERADISALTTLSQPHPIDYVVYQAPNVAYGVIPRHAEDIPHAQSLIAGVSIMLDGNSSLLDILQKDKYFLHLPGKHGILQRYDLVVGHDANAVDVAYHTFRNEALTTIAGKVTMSAGAAAVGARVGVFRDANGDGQIGDPSVDADGDGRPDERAISYMDVAADGTYTGQIPMDAGNLLLRAEVKNVGRSPAMPVGAQVNLVVPSPIKVDFQILDDATGLPIPGRLLVVGDHPAFPDKRLFEVADRLGGVVTSQHCIRGTTVDLGDGVDPALYLPAGGTYRIYASRGTEWSMASQPVAGDANLTFKLAHVNPAVGYLATDWHVHQVGSPDSPILSDERVRSAVSAGVEMFATTDHDYVSDLQPYVEAMHLEHLLRVVPGIEVTPFAYGHYQTWPLTPDNNSANHGAIDWGRGQDGFAMVPAEIYAAMRARGGKMVQVNHPRHPGFTEFQSAFVRANIKYDYVNRTIYGDYMNANVPNDYLRLPEVSLWSDQFNGLEVWNGFDMADTDGDGIRENRGLDRVLRDWVAMLSLGMYVTPFGNSDTHTTVADPLGMPRTFIRVADDSAAALADGSAIDAVVQTQTGANNTARDIVVTDGPMIDVKVGGQPALGRVAPATGGTITFNVTLTAADWAEFDTLEVFANATPDALPGDAKITTMVPLKCYTSRALNTVTGKDPCALAALAPEAMTVTLAPFGNGFQRYQATVAVTLDVSDIATRTGATGKDAWVVFRVRGNRSIFPVWPSDAVTPDTQAALLGGDFATIRTALTGIGVSAAAFTAPVFVDFDGGGYRAPFAP